MPNLGISGHRAAQQTPTEQVGGGAARRASEQHWPVQFAGAQGARIDGVLHARSPAVVAGDLGRTDSRSGSTHPGEFSHAIGRIMAWVGITDPKEDAPLRDSLQRYWRPREDQVALPALGPLRFGGSGQHKGRAQAQATMAFAIEPGGAGRPASQP